MPGTSLVQVGATIACPHAGQTSIVSANARVLLSGVPAATAADQFVVAGCAFAPGGKPQPCVSLRWLSPSTRVLIGGAPAVLQASSGIAQSAEQLPQGPPTVAAAQAKAKGI